MRRPLLAIALVLPSFLAAQTSPPKTVRDLALDIGMGLSRLEMAACRAAHPAHAESFSGSLVSVSNRLDKALDDLKAKRAEELAMPVPPALTIGQDLMAALHGSDTATRTLDACLKTAREILNVSEPEAAGLMSQLVTTLVRASAQYKRDMERVLR